MRFTRKEIAGSWASSAQATEYLAGLALSGAAIDPKACRLAIIRAATGAFPQAVSDGMEKQALATGFELVMKRDFDPAITDFTDILDAVEQARPDLLLGVGRIQNDLLLARQITERGLRSARWRWWPLLSSSLRPT